MKKLTYETAISKIKKIQNLGSKPGLERIKKLLSLINNPQNNLKYIHIAGTNGKGSVSYMTASILKESGYKVGLYTSPSITDFRERIQINGKLISKKKVSELIEFFEPFLNEFEKSKNPITEFELTTAMAFKYFNDEKCNIVILETGLGGKLDATNVIEKSLCSVITSVSLDHTQILGDTLEKISSEKLGILKAESPLVLGPNVDKSVYNQSLKIAKKLNSTVYLSKVSDLTNINLSLKKGTSFKYKNLNLKSPLLGLHQLENISTVLKIFETIKKVFYISEKSLKNGFLKTKIPCRLEIINKSPLVILDGAHNPAGANTLADFIKTYFPKNTNLIGIVGIYKDKDYISIISKTAPLFDKIIAVSPPSERALPLEIITNEIKKYNKNVTPCHTIKQAFQTAHDLSKTNCCNSPIIAFGSFSIMKEIKEIKT